MVAVATPSLAFEVKDAGASTMFYISIPLDYSISKKEQQWAAGLQLQGKPKSFQLVRLRAPITLEGSFAHPAVGIKPGEAIAQGGIAAALGFLSPLASILAFIDPGLAKDANCGAMLTQAKALGAPVKSAAIANAQAPRK